MFQGFKKFYCNVHASSPFHLSALNWKTISKEDASYMTRQFSLEEIWVALQDSDSRKAPGPDGFNAVWLKML